MPRKRKLSDALDESIGFLICDAARFIKRTLYGRLSARGVRGGSWFLLRLLWLRDGITQAELSQKLGLMQPSVLEMLLAMERDGLIYRTRDAKDRRRVLIYLTPRAKRLESELMSVAREVNALMLRDIPTSSEATLKTAVRNIRNALAHRSPRKMDEDSEWGPASARPASRGERRARRSAKKSSAP
jgi:DNA-binding MarR family transcriptional regulator